MSWQAELLNIVLRLACKSRLQNRPFELARSGFEDLLSRASRWAKVPDTVERQHATVGGVPCWWVVAESARGASGVIVYFHGGAFMSGSPETHADVAWRLSAASERQVLLVDYRLSPRHPYPAAQEDALAVYAALRATDPTAPITFAGDSAGANLALATISRLVEARMALPDACVCLSPWVDLSHQSPGIHEQAAREVMLPLDLLEHAARSYAGARPLDDAAISPLYADLSGFPPLLIYASEDELLLNDARRLAARAKAAGAPVKLCIWPRQAHAFPTIAAFVPEARAAIAEIGNFARLGLGVEGRSVADVFARLHFEHVTEIERVSTET